MFGLLSGCTTVSAQHLDGYLFGNETAPNGQEWQSPEKLSLNKELPHAWFFSFQDTEAAKGVLPEKATISVRSMANGVFIGRHHPKNEPKALRKTTIP